MMKKSAFVLSVVWLCAVLAGCSETSAPESSVAEETSAQEEMTTQEETTAPEEETTTQEEDTTAAEEETAETPVETVAPVEVVEEGMTPVYPDVLQDGDYVVTVNSSSSMFNITDCILHVQDGEMFADMTMGGTGYLYLFMGTGEEAAAAEASSYIPFVEADGIHTFTVPVEALDAGIACAAYSKKKEAWYDRTILFRADSLPAEAFAEGYFMTAESLELADGEYTVEVTLEGGSGKASVESPARLTVADGNVTAEIIWSSNNYDYMIVDGERYDPITMEEFSIFEIPVLYFDDSMPVSADTIAMSTPHEIEYTLYFDSSTITQ